MRKVSLFIAMSLDGYIATKDHQLDFLKLVEREGEDYGYGNYIANVDTIIIGRKTYDYVKEHIGLSHYQQSECQVIVLSRTAYPVDGNIRFYQGNLLDLLMELGDKPGKKIYCDGGAEVINEFLKLELIDEMTISIIPILLGDGIRLFTENKMEMQMTLLSSTSFDSGLVQVHYKFN